MEFEKENIYSKIQEIMGNSQGSLNILEEQIDIDLQIEYFEYPRDFKDKISDDEIIESKDDIFKSNISVEDRKNLFVQLASVDKVEAYKTIEAYIKSDQSDLDDWAKLALQESKMLLESRLLDTNQVFISTGLGGKGLSLRYFIVLIPNKGEKLNDFRKEIIRSEAEYMLKRNNCELEDVEFTNEFAALLCIVPLQESLKELFYNIISECNNYGNFLRLNYIITNVKVLSFEEINEFISDKLDI